MGERGLILQRRLLTAGMFAYLLWMKLRLLDEIYYYGPDGSYYVDVARQVRDGLGLRSWLSMYHSGAMDLPSPSTIYPIWPLLLGLCARVVPVDTVVSTLPTILYFGTLILGVALVRRVWPRALLPGLWEVPDAGHVFLLFFGFNALFFEYTSKPYTEGLAYFLLVVLAWRLHGFFERASVGRASVGRAMELGAWISFLILVRSQMFLLTFVGIGVCVWAVLCLRPLRQWIPLVLAGVAGWFLALFPQYLWLRTFTEPSLDALLRFEHHHASTVLSPVVMLGPSLGLFDLLLDRAHGFRVAYANVGKYRYEANFGVIHWAQVACLPWLLKDLLRGVGPGGLRRAREALREPGYGPAIAYGLLAVGGFLSIHALHKSYGAEWNFATRHALTVVFLAFGAVLYLAARGGLARVFAIAIVSISALMEVRDLDQFVEEVRETEVRREEWHPELRIFLEAEHARNPDLLVAAELAQRMGWLVPGIGMHWLWTGTPLEDLERMFTSLHADYLVVLPDEDEHLWLADRAQFDARFERVHADLSGFEVYAYRRAPLAPGGADGK